MPDPTLKTLSATETAGLFGVSPYVTKWMLYQRFANGMNIDSTADARMNWGKKLQPLVLQQCAEDLRFEVEPNADDIYHRRGLLGCTRDAQIICPDRGHGALETKCVFDYRTWMSDWQGGKAPPRQHEIQLQQQMFVGDPNGEPYSWGVIAAWVAGEQHYFERQPIPELWDRMQAEAAGFFDAVAARKEPDPFGSVLELELLARVFPTIADKVIDLSGDADAEKHVETAQMYAYHKAEEGLNKKAAEALRAKLIALAKDAAAVLLPYGASVTVSTSKVGARRLGVFIPKEPTAAPKRKFSTEEILSAG